MEKVILRVYNREIETMIEGGKLDEAVAHCQHILKTFPLHVETYRLLGKAFLEAHRYIDAADIFQRVLLAVPDDFMSHLGMSIIRDDQGRLNDAIWHMERALEIQPSNSAIQSELRRLYGRRDGAEPSKIRLGRDALANMYSQGELFPQAIAEFRSLLAEDPNRPDLQVMLMRACYRSGQKGEANEIATTLLKKYPYCMDALRVLVDSLHDTAKAENIPVFRHRLFMLDPYSSFSLESAFASDQVADSAVSLERLEYKPGLVSGSSQPDWTSSLGIKLDSERFGPRFASVIDAGTVPFPDWMRPVSSLDVTGKEEHGSTDSEDVQSIAPIAKAEIPEWLISKDPTSTNQAANLEPDLPFENPTEGLPEGEDDIPDWLKSIYPSKVTEDVQKESQESGDSSPSSGDIDDKHITPPPVSGNAPELRREFIESLSADNSDIPDWLKPMTPLPITQDEITEPEQYLESKLANGEDVPGFLKPKTQDEPVEQALLEPHAPEEYLSEEGQEVPEPLESKISAEATGEELLAPPMTEESLLEDGEEVSGYPESRIPPEVADTSKVVSEPALPEETVMKTGSEPASAEASSSDGAAFPDWMREIGAGAAAVVLPAVEPIEEAPQAEQVVSEQPAIEQPVTEPPVSEQHVIEQPVAELPASEQPVVEQPAIEPVVPEQPVVEQPAIEPVVPEQPVVEQPVIEQAVPVESDIAGSAGQEAVQPPVTESETIPLDHSVEIPEWLQEPEGMPIEAYEIPVQEPDRNVAETAPIEPAGGMDFEAMSSSSSQNIDEALSEGEEKAVSGAPSEIAAKTALEPAGGEEDTLVWLERLSADQETTKEGSLVSPEGSQVASPEVDQEIADTQPMVRAMEEPVPAPSGTAGIVEEAVSKPSIEPTGEEKPAAAEEELPEWLKGLGGLSGQVDSHNIDQDLPDWLGNPLVNAEEVPEFLGSKEPAEVADTSKVVSEPALPEETVMKTGSEPASAEASSSDGAAFPDWMREIGAGAAAVVLPAVEPIEEAPQAEQVVSEQPAIEQPVTEPPVSEQHVIEQPVAELPASEQPVVEQPAIEPVVPEQPVVEQPAIEPVVPEQPVVEQPVIEQAVPVESDIAGSAGQEAVQPPVTESETIPLDHSVEIPEWLQEPEGMPIEAYEIPVQEPDRNVAETAPIEPAGGMDFEAMSSSSSQNIDEALSEGEEKAVSGAPSEIAAKTALEPAGGEEDTLVWLERLSADQETTKEGSLVSPEGSQVASPEVDQEIADTQPMVRAMEEPVPAPSEAADIAEEAVSKLSDEPASEEKPISPEEEIPEWLKGLEDFSGPLETPKASDDVPESQRLPIPFEEPELATEPEEPVWVDENIPVTGQAVPTTPEEWVPVEKKPAAGIETGPTPESTPVDETLLASVLGPTSETIQVSKPESPADFTPVAESVPASETQQISRPELPIESKTGAESGSASETMPIAIPEPTLESMLVAEPEPVTESTPIAEPVKSSVQNLTHPETVKEEGLISNVALQEKDSELLAGAQALLEQNSLDDSMKQYSRLIKKGHLLDDVIKDLLEATHRYPVDVNIWQTLGDAYMRVNRLEDALDAYTKGEELLR